MNDLVLKALRQYLVSKGLTPPNDLQDMILLAANKFLGNI